MENKMIPEELTGLITRLNGENESERAYAIQVMTEIEDSTMGKLFFERLIRENSVFVKEALVEALKKRAFPSIYESVYDLFQSEDAYLRNAAIQILSFGGLGLINFLRKSYDSADNDVKKLIFDTLFEIGSNEAKMIIRKGLYESNANLRITAIEYLAKLEDYESIDVIIDILKDEKEPMIIMVILDSILLLADEDAVNRVIEILIPGRDLNKLKILNSAFLSVTVKLLGKSASKNEFMTILDLIPGNESFYQDIIYFLNTGIKRFREIIEEKKIKDLIVKILLFKELDDKMTYDVLNLLCNSELEELTSKIDEFMNEWKDDLYKFRNEIAKLL